MPDFTSVLYLGMQHAHAELRPWQHLTTGRPAALGVSARAFRLAGALATLMGHQAAVLGASTLHLFWDLFAGLASERRMVLVDAGTYPIARWGVERAAAAGMTVATFPHHDARALRERLSAAGRDARPVIVTDGLCPLTGQPAPLGAYAQACRAVGGLLVVDDTQGLGLFGRGPDPACPYGVDGAGTPAWWGVRGRDILVVGSLAKAFGVPMAVMAGGAAQIARFTAASLTRIHCSPPSMMTIAAAEHALALNADKGPERRRRLLDVVLLFRRRLASVGLDSQGGFFPFQTLVHPTGAAAVALHGRLSQEGIRTVLHHGPGGPALITFVITCLHSPHDIAVAVESLGRNIFGHARVSLAS